MNTCPCQVAWPDTPEFCDGHTPAVIALARQIAEVYQVIPVTEEQVGWYMEDAVTIVGELGDGPFGVIENAEGLKPEGYPRYGFDGAAVIVDDVWFAVLSRDGSSDLVRLTDDEAMDLWRYSVGEIRRDQVRVYEDGGGV